MNKLLRAFALTLALITACPMLGLAQKNLESDPAYLNIDGAIDLKTIRPEVNVNLPRFLIQDALAELNGGPDDPLAKSGINLADLTKDIKLIRVVVIKSTATNRVALTKGIDKLRATLNSKWTAIADVPEENVAVYALSDPSGESMAGIAVLVNNGGQAVIANIVGRVSIGKIVKIASQMDKFPKDLLKKLSGGELVAPPGVSDKPEGEANKAAARN